MCILTVVVPSPTPTLSPIPSPSNILTVLRGPLTLICILVLSEHPPPPPSFVYDFLKALIPLPLSIPFRSFIPLPSVLLPPTNLCQMSPPPSNLPYHPSPAFYRPENLFLFFLFHPSLFPLHTPSILHM